LIAHDAAPFDCTGDADCPSGTVCAPASSADDLEALIADFSSCAVPEKIERTCQIPATRSGLRQALTQGFGVKAFALTGVQSQTSSRSAEFTWKDAGYAVVHCALFACRPEVRPVDGRRVIANYDECVIAREIFEPGSGVFDLSNPELQYTSAIHKSGCKSLKGPRISELLVGCWAYDSTSLVAATPLEVVDLSTRDIFNYRELFASTCAADTIDRACVTSCKGRLGACRGAGDCAELCVTDRDCMTDSVTVGVEDDAATADLSPEGNGGSGGAGGAPATGVSSGLAPSPACQRAAKGYVGYCNRPTEIAP
jgi:hypothetical protein